MSEPQHQDQGFVYRNLHNRISEGHFFPYQCIVVVVNMHTDLGGQTVDGLYQGLVAVHPLWYPIVPSLMVCGNLTLNLLAVLLG